MMGEVFNAWLGSMLAAACVAGGLLGYMALTEWRDTRKSTQRAKSEPHP